MKFKEIYEKIQQSKIFKDFIEKNPEAEFCAGFFVMDFLSNDNKSSVDYKVGEKIFTFDLTKDDDVLIKEDRLMDIPDVPKLTKIKPEVKIELDELKSIAGVQALDHGISAKMHKIIAVLQNYEGKQAWNLTCVFDQLIILHIIIDSETGEILKYERRSMMDLIRKK
ncbi:hypothetical protein GF386_02605 [Candidatus Pacearchaeota archaeon]|nr:hypothetical protein [Candidatus Pacearchaeota archaeon]MBD3283035.1 hypothetical protein [Candidatus Pacearchaeota archaeon]